MKIEITDHRKIFSVQEEFRQSFPFLKLDFYSKPHVSGGTAAHKLIRHSAKTIGNCRTMHRKGFVTVTPNMTIRDLQQTFADVYGLAIRISRKCKEGWTDVSSMDAWAIEKHNNEGKLSTTVN